MLCSRCHQHHVAVHVVEIEPDAVLGVHGGPKGIHEEHLCLACAKLASLPHGTIKKTAADIWNMLQTSSTRSAMGAGIACPGCRMTLAEFRHKGRLGCPKCYETFGPHLQDLLERIHGAVTHVGRVPGLADEDVDRRRKVSELERELETAIRAEAYENAARIRDELNQLRGSTA